MYRKYYSYNDMPKPIVDKKSGELSLRHEDKPCPAPKPEQKKEGFLSGIPNDDLILAAVLLILLIDGCEDKLLLAAIGFILLGDI